MRAKLLHHDAGERVFALVFDTGEDPVAGLTRFAEEQDLTGAGFTAIGAFREARLGYFDWGKKCYDEIPVGEQTEVLALVGDVAVEEDGRKKAAGRKCTRTSCSVTATARHAAGISSRRACVRRSR